MASSSIPRTSGIYKITCTANGKIYIGSSINLHKRWNEHQRHLLNNHHHSPLLQRAYNKYGKEKFILEIIELVMPWSLIDRENYWLETLKPYDNKIGFNISPRAEAGMNGRKHTPESRKKMSIAQTGKKHTLEQKEKIAAVHRGKTKTPEAIAKTAAFHRGRKRSPETVERIRIAVTGRKCSDKSKAVTSVLHKGKIVPKEVRAKISASHMGIKSSPESITKRILSLGNHYEVFSPLGEISEVYNLNQFCKDHKLSQSRMSAVSRGEQDNHRGWKVRRIN